MSAPDPESPLLVDPSKHRPPRSRSALRPAICVTAAVAAVGLASAVAVLAFGPGSTRPVATRAVALSTTESTDARMARGAQVGIAAADRPTVVPGSATPTAGGVAPTGTPTAGRPAPSTPTTAAKSTPTRAKTAPATPPAGDAGAEAAVLTLVNQERGKAGCGPLTADSRLATAARLHSEDMAARNFFDHTNPDGVTFDQRITKAGYRWSGAAENIAKGQTTPASVMDSWMHSPGHRANILNCGFKNIGIGLAYQGRSPLWTQDFGSPLG
jgi:uncharacterized protein YkwD